jgi:transposase
MAVFDSEKVRFVDRVRAITFREAKEAGASFISRSWIAARIRRSETFVKDNWNKDPYTCDMNTAPIGLGGRKLSEESKQILSRETGKRKRSVRYMTALLEEERGKPRARETVRSELHRMGFKPFHTVKKPMKSELNIEDRIWFCAFLRDWGEEDFMHLAPSDEFFVYAVRKPNHQNDRIWAHSLDEIDDGERLVEVSQGVVCVGIFLCFTARSLLWVVKEKGETWSGEYFRTTILQKEVIPFLKNPANVLDPKEVCFLHDKAPCFKALATQAILRESGLDFFSSSEWPGNSPDLNATENLGAILKERVETQLLREPQPSRERLTAVITTVLTGLKEETALFERLLRSYPSRIKAVVEAGGGHTEY